MEIKTEQDMEDFCNLIKNPVDIYVNCNLTPQQIAEYRMKNAELIQKGFLNSYEIPQGIGDICHDEAKGVSILEVPRLFPAPKVLEQFPEYTGSLTGVLVNEYDPVNKRFLFHLRGKGVDSPWGFQAAAAGFVTFGESHYTAAVGKELKEEEGSCKVIPVIGRKAFGIFPFMKGKIPQPLSAFGFLYDSSSFPQILYPILNSLEQIAEFEDQIKTSLKKGTLQPREAYHFNIPVVSVEKVVREIYDRDPSQQGKNGGFFGPIAESHERFLRLLSNQKYI